MNHQEQAGFSIIELLIVVALIGIISVIAVGFYGDNVIASNRSEGRSALSATAGALEKCKSLHGAYDSANCTVTLPFNSDSNYYSIDATAIDGVSFTLTATPNAGEPQANDDECDSMTLTNTGIKGGTGTDPSVCW